MIDRKLTDNAVGEIPLMCLCWSKTLTFFKHAVWRWVRIWYYLKVNTSLKVVNFLAECPLLFFVKKESIFSSVIMNILTTNIKRSLQQMFRCKNFCLEVCFSQQSKSCSSFACNVLFYFWIPKRVTWNCKIFLENSDQVVIILESVNLNYHCILSFVYYKFIRY